MNATGTANAPSCNWFVFVYQPVVEDIKVMEELAMRVKESNMWADKANEILSTPGPGPEQSELEAHLKLAQAIKIDDWKHDRRSHYVDMRLMGRS